MKPPSKKLWIALIAAIVIVVVISIVTGKDRDETQKLADSNVVFINDSNTPVGLVGISTQRWDGTSESMAGCNADGSLMERGDRLYFDVKFPAVVTLYEDIQGSKPLAAVAIEENPPEELQEGVWYVIVRDGPEGTSLSLSLNLDEEELEEMEESISENLGVDVSGGEIGYCWYPGHGIQGDGEDFVVMHFSQQAATALVQEFSAVEGWQQSPFPAQLKTETFESVYSHESLIDWDEVSASGWFYFRDEQEEKHPAQQVQTYRSWDYVAAVYDAATRTLYFFEWHQ